MMTEVRIHTARFLIGMIALTASLTNLVGCAGTGGAVVAAPPWWEAHLTLDRDLKSLGLRELRLVRSRSESGFLRVTGDYVNRSDTKLSAIYRFTWLDASGQPVGSILGGWQAVHTLPRSRATFAGIAPRDDIQDFRVELMAAHRLKSRPAQKESDR